MLFILFDFDLSENIDLNELLVIFKSIILGYCKLTKTKTPSYTDLEKYAKITFLKSELSEDNAIELNFI